jgi:hypothetical protein
MRYGVCTLIESWRNISLAAVEDAISDLDDDEE